MADRKIPGKTRPGDRGKANRNPNQRVSEGADYSLLEEVRSIIRRAAEHDGRIVIIGQLTLFSTETGDGWIIDRDDHLALRLARDGDSEPFHIEETDTCFTIDWRGRYDIKGAAFIYTDRDTGRTTAILGYPTKLLAGQK